MKELIRHILKEEKIKHAVLQLVKDDGAQTAAEMVGGFGNLLKILNINYPMDFLHIFDGMEVVQSEDYPDWTLFRYKPKNNIMVYDRKEDEVYINYDDIWLVLEDHFGLNYTEIQRFTKRWLDEVYNLRGITTFRIELRELRVVG